MPELILRATCRHCGQRIEQISAGWVNEAGWFACAKAPSILDRQVLHEPMPEGLRGAPKKEEFAPLAAREG